MIARTLEQSWSFHSVQGHGQLAVEAFQVLWSSRTTNFLPLPSTSSLSNNIRTYSELTGEVLRDIRLGPLCNTSCRKASPLLVLHKMLKDLLFTEAVCLDVCRCWLPNVQATCLIMFSGLLCCSRKEVPILLLLKRVARHVLRVPTPTNLEPANAYVAQRVFCGAREHALASPPEAAPVLQNSQNRMALPQMIPDAAGYFRYNYNGKSSSHRRLSWRSSPVFKHVQLLFFAHFPAVAFCPFQSDANLRCKLFGFSTSARLTVAYMMHS